jgi:hypothetical protein
MAELFASGRLVDLILVVVVLEAAGLLLLWRSARRGIAPLDLLPNLCAGGFLLLALRAALSGGGWVMASGCLAAAGLAHLIDLYRRWRGERR